MFIINTFNFTEGMTEEVATFKIYTKTGDQGSSSLYTGDRLNKNDAIFDSLGSVDELNAHLGLAI